MPSNAPMMRAVSLGLGWASARGATPVGTIGAVVSVAAVAGGGECLPALPDGAGRDGGASYLGAVGSGPEMLIGSGFFMPRLYRRGSPSPPASSS